jgi:hypothetical protein
MPNSKLDITPARKILTPARSGHHARVVGKGPAIRSQDRNDLFSCRGNISKEVAARVMRSPLANTYKI